MQSDETWMARALELAAAGRYSVSPNPMVGCVIVRNGVVVGEGHHERAGEPHAEVHALRAAGEAARGATAYVTLEPCSHQGRTPPCADALIAAGVVRVVVAAGDPSPAVDGRGVGRLRSAGVAVDEGVLAERASILNEVFLFSARRGRPFVVVKAGMSLDGKLATITGRSRWITGEESRHRGLALREELDAILVGSGTIALDDPHLTRRLGWNSSIVPYLRVVIDAGGRLPETARVLTDGGPTLVVTTRPARLRPRGSVEVEEVDDRDGLVDPEDALAILHARGIHSVLVEGGSALMTSVFRQRVWQKLVLFVAPTLLGGADAPSILARGYEELADAPRFRFDRVEHSGTDLVITAYPE